MNYLVLGLLFGISVNAQAFDFLPERIKLPGKVVIVPNEVSDTKDGLFHDSKQKERK